MSTPKKLSAMNAPGYKHLVMPIALTLIFGTMLFPLPTTLLDIAIAMSITSALIVLFVSLYMSRPLDFSSFPSVLLITTLFRLALNISTTRSILLNGKEGTDAAGHVIQAFGQFVIGGNYAVGVVIFIAISIINLKVITKGSSRIAEVAARFTLDAMPGKQMAIDSDLNMGVINEADAKERRRDLSREAEFYGAMDGAAKFVSGDAIAGLFIAAINVFGGLFIGIVQQGLDWRAAAQIYTLLTVGDGLVSQIPSVIISTASGIIVARAASSGEDLGTEIMGQMSTSSRPLALSSAVAFCCAILPGLPMLPFITIGAALGGLAYMKRNLVSTLAKTKADDDKKKIEEASKPKPGSKEEVTQLLGMDTLELEVGYELVSLVEAGDLVERIRSLRRQFALDYGFVVPPIHIRDNVRIKSSEYRFMLRGSAIGKGELKHGCLLAMDPGGVQSPLEGTPTKEPAFGLDALWIRENEKERAQFSGYTVVDLGTVVVTHITELVRSHMAELLTRQDTQHLIESVQKDNPKLVEELMPTLLNVGQVQQVLSHLLREQVSIRDLKTILETLADWAPTVKHPERLAEYVRRRLARQITGKFVTGDGTLPLVTLTPTLERSLGESLQQGDEGSFLAIEPGLAQQLINKLGKLGERFAELGQTPLLLAPTHLRPALVNFLHRFAPSFAVMSHSEIAPNTKVQSLGVVSVE